MIIKMQIFFALLKECFFKVNKFFGKIFLDLKKTFRSTKKNFLDLPNIFDLKTFLNKNH